MSVAINSVKVICRIAKSLILKKKQTNGFL